MTDLEKNKYSKEDGRTELMRFEEEKANEGSTRWSRFETFYNWNYKKAFFKTSSDPSEDFKQWSVKLITEKLQEISPPESHFGDGSMLSRQICSQFFTALERMEGGSGKS